MADWPAYTPTRFPPLGLSRCPGYRQPTVWRFVDPADRPDAPAPVGPQYRTKGEALADLDRYAKDAGWAPAGVPWVEVDQETAYGVTIRMSRSIRVF